MTLNEIFLAINLISCLISATVLGTYQRNGATFKRLPAFFAMVLILACGINAIIIAQDFARWFLTGAVPDVCGKKNPTETIINAALCYAVITARGNVSHLFRRSPRQSKGEAHENK